MKNGKRPTKKQSILLAQKKLDPEMWLIVKNEPDKMLIVHRHSDKTMRTIYKD